MLFRTRSHREPSPPLPRPSSNPRSQLRYSVYQEQLWRTAAGAFNRAVPAGLAALRGAPPADAARSWAALAAALEDFLLGAAHLRAGGGAAAAGAGGGARVVAPPPRADGLPVVPLLSVAAPAAPLAAPASPSAASSAPPPPPVDAAQARADAELELAVLDALADVALTRCGGAGAAARGRLVAIVDAGVARPAALAVAQGGTAAAAFSHVCLRKMYALCARGEGAGGSGVDADAAADAADASADDAGAAVLLAVARAALPRFLLRSDGMLRAFSEEARGAGAPGADGGAPVAAPRLDEALCALEALAALALAPAVADAALPPRGEPLAEVVAALRGAAAAAGAPGRRERSHLLLLHPAIAACAASREPRAREMARDVLGLAGAELGLAGALGGLRARAGLASD